MTKKQLQERLDKMCQESADAYIEYHEAQDKIVSLLVWVRLCKKNSKKRRAAFRDKKRYTGAFNYHSAVCTVLAGVETRLEELTDS